MELKGLANLLPEFARSWGKPRPEGSDPGWRRRPLWRWLRGKLLRRSASATGNRMLPVVIEVFAGFSKVDGQIDEQDIDSSLGFLRYDYPEAVYSELREHFSRALREPQDLSEIAAKLRNTLTADDKILLGVQLYVLISRGLSLHREQLITFYLFMTNLGVASEAIELVHELDRDNLQERASRPSFTPLEVLRVASRKPADLVIESLTEDQALIAFRLQNQVLLKNIGSTPLLVRGRSMIQGEFRRLYEGQRIVLGDSVLDHQDLVFYFNTKKDVSSAQLYLALEPNGQPFLERLRGKNSHLEIRFGLGISIRVLRNTSGSINGRRLREGLFLEAKLSDKILFDDRTEVSFRELHRLGRDLGGRFDLLPSRSEYLVSNNPNLLRPGDILLSPGVSGEVLLRIRCDYARHRGDIEVLAAPHDILVDGLPTKDKAVLRDDATITIEDGQFLRCHFTDRIIEEERNVINRLDLREVSHSYDGKESALDSISLRARRGEMICVIGPSGCGKSSLLRVLSGHLKPSRGGVKLNHFDLYQHRDNLIPYVCYIPQEDAFDSHLTVQENVDFAGAIRAPNVSSSERRKRVDAKLAELGLNERRHRLAGTPEKKHLSGGERKRLNLGMDMIGPADVYLIDEPTTGLSSKDSEHVMEIIHELSHNKIVFVSIHQPSTRLFHMFDKALLLDLNGKMAFFGTPREMLRYFQEARDEALGTQTSPRAVPEFEENATPDFIFDVLETPLRDLSGAVIYEEVKRGNLAPSRRFPPNFWRDRYQAHRTIREIKTENSEESRTMLKGPPPLPPIVARPWREKLTQALALFSRAFLSKLRNRGNIVTTLLEAPFLALLISLVLRYSEGENNTFYTTAANYTFGTAFHIPTYLFLTLVVAMFLGLTNSADEIIRDRSMLTRERNYSVPVSSYVLSKFLTLGFFALLQCVIYLLIGNAILEIRGMFWEHLRWMLPTTLCGVTIGMLISSLVTDVKTALNIIPMILLPQIILGGALIKFQEMNRDINFLAGRERWTDEKVDLESSLKIPLISELMPLRWSYEAMILTQDSRNPLDRLLAIIADYETPLLQLKTLAPDQERRLRDLKEARAAALQLEASNGDKIAKEIRRITRRVHRDSFSANSYAGPVPEPKVHVQTVFRNRKIHDLVTLSDAVISDHTRDPKKSFNVFLGMEKTYFGLKLRTLTVNLWVLVGFNVLSMSVLWAVLRRQLTRTKGL